jgi:hypothetical protein
LCSYYNLAKIYWYLDDPDAGLREANELVMNGFDAKDGKGLETGATNLKLQLRQAKRSSRHFRLNVEDYQGVDTGTVGTEDSDLAPRGRGTAEC